MLIKTFGAPENGQNPKIILLHPMLLTGEAMALLAGKLRQNYCIIAPDLAGHGDDRSDFVSAKQEAEQLYTYLRAKGWLQIELIYGASLGAVVGRELLAYRGLKVHTAVLDACPLFGNAKTLRFFIKRIFLGAHRLARQKPALAQKVLCQKYGATLGPGMAEQFARMSEQSVRGIVNACSRCTFYRYPKQLHLHFEFGSADFDRKQGQKNIPIHYPDASVTIREGYGHCQYMAAQGEKMGDLLEQYLLRDKATE